MCLIWINRYCFRHCETFDNDIVCVNICIKTIANSMFLLEKKMLSRIYLNKTASDREHLNAHEWKHF